MSIWRLGSDFATYNQEQKLLRQPHKCMPPSPNWMLCECLKRGNSTHFFQHWSWGQGGGRTHFIIWSKTWKFFKKIIFPRDCSKTCWRTKRFVFYINIKKIVVNFRNTWYERCWWNSPLFHQKVRVLYQYWKIWGNF